MLVLLPPSETKRPGGDRPPVDLPSLRWPELAPLRSRVLEAVRDLAADPEATARVLKIGARQRDAVVSANREIFLAGTLPAVRRYTGVLFDALSYDDLDEGSRAWVGDHVAISSAAFGPVGAHDLLPQYRLSAASRLPGLPPAQRLWSAPVSEALAETAEPFILDLRSAAYSALGPVPDGRGVWVRVMAEGDDGQARALNHFNKAAKGRLVRALAERRACPADVAELINWGHANGHRFAIEDDCTLRFIIDQS